MSATYKTQIKNAQNSFELSCIWEDVRNAFWIKKTISREMYDKRGAEIVAKRNEISKKHQKGDQA